MTGPSRTRTGSQMLCSRTAAFGTPSMMPSRRGPVLVNASLPAISSPNVTATEGSEGSAPSS